MTASDDGLEQEVQRAAPDLWLSSRLVGDNGARTTLIGLYALHAELAKLASTVTTPLAGEIRLAWWREEVDAAVRAQRPAGHPALARLAGIVPSAVSAIQAMIEARHSDLEPRPFADEAALMIYLDGVDGGLVSAASAILCASPAASLTHTGRVLGLSRLIRTRQAWQAQCRDWAPTTWGEASDGEILAHVQGQVFKSAVKMRQEISALPVAAFPAVAHAALIGLYSRGGRPTELQKRLRLIWASVRGRV